MIINYITIFIVSLFLASCSLYKINDSATNKGTCTGKSNCRVCKNCKYCNHCTSGGSCGMCR